MTLTLVVSNSQVSSSTVEHRSPKPRDGGSNPLWPAKISFFSDIEKGADKFLSLLQDGRTGLRFCAGDRQTLVVWQ